MSPSPTPDDSSLIQIRGLILDIPVYKEDTGFQVLKVEVPGEKDPVIVVGVAGPLEPGEEVELSGSWVIDRRYGRQFKATAIRGQVPTTLYGLEKYLGSGMIPGIGTSYANLLIQHFGLDLPEVIETKPERLTEVPGIGAKRAERIIAGWNEHKAVHDLMMFLYDHGAQTAQATRIYRKYGYDAVAIIQRDPYRVAREVRGIGFQGADRIAAHVGIPRDSLIRIRAGIAYTLSQAIKNNGDCGLPEGDLIQQARTLLSSKEAEIPTELIERGLSEEIKEGTLLRIHLRGQDTIFLTWLHVQEEEIARRILALARQPPPWGNIDTGRAVAWGERHTGRTLDPSQRHAIEQVLQHSLSIITGGPGVGKTTVTRTLLAILAAKRLRLVLAAPTGTAAKRMQQATGKPAQTMHRLLKAGKGGFKHNTENPLEGDVFVLDEQSMTDIPLMLAFLRALPPHCVVILIGDADQLPSVGPGRVLRDLIASQRVYVSHLTEIHRQARNSHIITNAHLINRGEMPDLSNPEGTDFFFIPAEDGAEATEKIVHLVRDRLPRKYGLDPIRDIQVFSPMRIGDSGTEALNARLQEALNPHHGGNQIERKGWTYRVGDKVMHRVNNEELNLRNGDIGFITEVNSETGTLSALYDLGTVQYNPEQIGEISLAYAYTIHKSQGSESPCVIIPITTQHSRLLERSLLYTGVTRASRILITVGQKKAWRIGVRKQESRRRISALEELLRKG